MIGRVFTAERPNACWLSDITYIPTREGWLYLAAVLDVYSRAVVGWAMSRTLDCKLATDALSMAIGWRGPPGIPCTPTRVRPTRPWITGNCWHVTP